MKLLPKKRSQYITETKLMEHNLLTMNGLFIDLVKAFDTVSREVLFLF